MDFVPLREHIEEIRLITILPPSPDGLVHCIVKAVSLKDTTAAYRAHTLSPHLRTIPKTEELSTWNNATARSEISNTEAAESPSPSQFRFEWGDYACLSYFWGDQKVTSSIVANGAEIQVTTNLEACLRVLQKRLMFDAGFKLWIDAICINQADTAERGRQISKMRDLYTGGMAINLLQNLSHYFIYEDHDKNETLRLNSEIQTLKLRLKTDPEHFIRGSWVALREFLDRPYWDRLWIIQEVVLSASKIVLCGDRFIDWDILCRGLGTIHTSLFVVKNELLEHDQNVCGVNYSKPWITKNFHRVWKDLYLLGKEFRQLDAKPLDVHRLLRISNQSLAFDVRDKFYGLLAIAGPDFVRRIHPSYDIDAGAVFNMVAKAHIQTFNSLEILREANPWGGNDSATWAPDWNWASRNRFRMPEIPYKASYNTVANAHFSNGDRIMTCVGLIVDKVDGLGPRHRDPSDPWDFIKDTMVQSQITTNFAANLDEMQSLLCKAITRERSWDIVDNDLTWHLSILNFPSDTDTAMVEFSKRGAGWEFLAAERDYYHRWSSWRRAHADFKVFGRRLDNFFTDQVPISAKPTDYIAAYQAAKGSSQAQRLVTTEKGRVGWVPDNNVGGNESQVTSGDLFCILCGCSVPIVMRPYKDGFIVLGEGYIQGLMEGEALQIGKEDCHLRDFKIF